MSPERTPDMFDAWAEEYDYYLDVGKNNFPLIGYNRVLDRIVELAEPEPHHKILDVGIGTGNLAQRFVKYNCEIWGIDFSSRMLEEAAKKLPNIRLLQVNVLSDWPPELKVRFNRIVSGYTIHHLKLAEKVVAIERMSRDLLEPSGLIIIGDVSFQTIKARDMARKKLGSEWDDDEFYWAADEILESLLEKGINVVYEQISEYAGIYKIRRG